MQKSDLETYIRTRPNTVQLPVGSRKEPIVLLRKNREDGFLKLFDYDGNEIRASRKDLLKAEAQTFDQKFWRRLVGNRSGRYWLISNRPGFSAMLLEISVFHCYPRTGDEWEIDFCDSIADYPHWELEGALRTFREELSYASPDSANDNKPIPANVEQLAHEHVTYRDAKSAAPDPLVKHGVRALDATKMRASLATLTDADTSELIEETAGRRVGAFDLFLNVEMFCSEHDLEGQNIKVAQLMVPATQLWRLHRLARKLGAQLASE